MYRSLTVEYNRLTIHIDDIYDILHSMSVLEGKYHIDDRYNSKMYNSMIHKCNDILKDMSDMYGKVYHMYMDKRCTMDSSRYIDKVYNIIHSTHTNDTSYFTSMCDDIYRRISYINQQLDIKNKLNDHLVYLSHQLTCIDIFYTHIYHHTHQYVQYRTHHTYKSCIVYMCIVLYTRDVNRLHKIIYRQSRGKMLYNTYSIDNDRSVIIILSASYLSMDIVLDKIDSMIDTIDGCMRISIEIDNNKRDKIVDIDNRKREYTHMISNIDTILHDCVYDMMDYRHYDGISLYDHYILYINRMKNIYTTMNTIERRDTLYIIYYWCTPDDNNQLRNALSDMSVDIHTIHDHHKTPPTLFMNNALLYPYQQMIDIYGICRYKELNPAVYSVASFPFLFSVMYGDIGHGIILLIISLCMMYEGNRYRYMVLMISIFSIYSGIIYNEYLGVSLSTQSTCYKRVDHDTYDRIDGCMQYVGIDSIWSRSRNHISYLNSYKMKLSIIIGVCHMMLGIVLKAYNYIYDDNIKDILLEVLPQLLLLSSTFGYMCILIVYKWLFDNSINILSIMINMIYTSGDYVYVYRYQYHIECILMYVSIVCVVMMMVIKPIYTIYNDDSDHTYDMVVHQIIDTIEYILGIVSNTASYLRLWALSLSHNQLSIVFYSILSSSYDMHDSVYYITVSISIRFILYMIINICILIIMSSMECVLHTVRLHWIEFMNKFFKGDGYTFIEYNIYSHIHTYIDTIN